jgi:hypothetical protein
MAFPRWLRASRPDASVHPEWQRQLDALGAVGLAQELDAAALVRLVPPAEISRAPDLDAIADALDGYYRARDRGPAPGESGKIEIDAAMRRCRRDRHVSVREGEGCSARTIVAKLRLAVPELGGLALVEEPFPRFAWAAPMVLRARGGVAALPVAAMEVEAVSLRDETYLRRTITVRALLGAANAILSKRGIAWRFLPIQSPEGVESYLAVTRDTATFLDPLAIWADPLEGLLPFACWREGSIFPPPRPA